MHLDFFFKGPWVLSYQGSHAYLVLVSFFFLLFDFFLYFFSNFIIQHFFIVDFFVQFYPLTFS
jgi:hypothetical protein